MTAENNEKYIAEDWLNSQEEEEFKVRVLQALLKQYQGHTENGINFNADMVDGMHWKSTSEEAYSAEYQYDSSKYIKDYIDESLAGLMKDFQIGYTKFSAARDLYHLGFDSIRLYNLDDEHENDTEPYNQLPWSNEPIEAELDEEIPTLWQVFKQLYELSYLGDDEEKEQGLTNKQIYYAFKAEFYEAESRLQALEDALRGKIVDGKLNADMVCGLRFFIYTPEQYQEMQTKAAQYDPNGQNTEEVVNNYNKLNSIHNIFIIKSRQELLDNGYPGEYDFNPDTNVIDKYYHFRVAEVTVDDVTDLWLQYRHDDAVQWQNLCLASDFIDYDKVKENLYDILEDENDYVLNETALSNSLKEIEDDTPGLPWVTYGNDTFLTGGVYNYQDENNKTQLDVVTINNQKYLNLNGLQTFLEEKITGVQSNLNTYKDYANGKLNSAESRIDANETDIFSIRNGNTNSIKTLSVDIEGHTRDIAEANSRITNLETNIPKWQEVEITGLKYSYGGKEHKTIYQYNKMLELSMLKFSIVHYHYGEKAYVWTPPSTKGTNGPSYYNNPNTKAKPVGTIITDVMAVDGNENKILSPVSLAIKSDGGILIRGTSAKNQLYIVEGTVLYRYNPLTSQELN